MASQGFDDQADAATHGGGDQADTATDRGPDDGGDGTAADTVVDEPTVATARTEISRGRRIFVNSLIGLTTLLLVLAMFSVYANRLLFNPDNWSTTSTKLLQNSNVRSTTAGYLTDQLYSNVNVAQVIGSKLPAQLQPLASPVAGALRNVVEQGIGLALTRPRVQSLWEQANRAADQTFIDVVNGKKGTVTVNQGVVTLNLGTILNNMAQRFGISANIAAKLPPNVATLTIFKSNQLKFVQDVGNAIKGLALALTIAVPLLYALAIALARGRRRRTLMTVGFACIIAGTLVFFGRSILQTQVASSLTTDASLRTTISDVVGISTEILSTVAGAVVFVGLLLVASAWFAGPARPARAGREALAPFLRERPVASYAVTLGLLVLLFIWDPIPATGTPAGIITFTALAMFGTFLLRRDTELEFPDARPGEATARMRARIQRRGPAEPTPTPNGPAGSDPAISDQLQHLADLRDQGALSTDEYQAAKVRLLGV